MRAAWLLAALAVAGCKKDAPAKAPSPADATGAVTPAVGPDAKKAGARVAAVPFRTGATSLGYGVFVPAGTDATDVRSALELTTKAAGITAEILVAKPDDIGFLPEWLDYKGRGLDSAAVAAIRASTQIVMIADEATEKDLFALELALAGAVHGATKDGGWIYDPFTSEVFRREDFAESRVGQTSVDVRRWMSIHIVSHDSGLVFLETRGLSRFGVPELFLADVPRAASGDAGELVNAAAQLLAERGALTADGELAVPGPKGTVTWTVTWSIGDQEPGAPADLLELAAPGSGDAPKRLYEAIEVHGGATDDPTVEVDHDDPELKAASTKAKQELASLAGHFANGIPDMEQLMIKAPFPTGDDGGNEWMWVEVQSWKGKTLRGVLINEPVLIDDLTIGDPVEIGLDVVYDYWHRRADGSEAGGETMRIMQRKYAR